MFIKNIQVCVSPLQRVKVQRDRIGDQGLMVRKPLSFFAFTAVAQKKNIQ